VIIGTLGATIFSFPMAAVKTIPSSYMLALKGPAGPSAHQMVENLVGMADKARREGLLALEEEAQNTEDPFTRKGLMLMIDGTDPESLRSIMEIEIDGSAHRAWSGPRSSSRVQPLRPPSAWWGRLGLIAVLSKLGGDAGRARQGHRGRVRRHVLRRGHGEPAPPADGHEAQGDLRRGTAPQEMVLEGVLSIQSGDNPRIVREKLQAYLPPHERTSEEDEAGAERMAA
jgi:chemotaxis protein MotA